MSEDINEDQTNESIKTDEASFDLHGGSVPKLLDKKNLYGNGKVLRTPYSLLLHCGFPRQSIPSIKAMYGKQSVMFKTSNEYFQQTEKFYQIKFNVESLDNLTRGGIDVGSVTEIFGEAGSGKTQICLQLALSCLLHCGPKGRTVYVSSDKHFPIKRLHDITEEHKDEFNFLSPKSPLDFIHIEELDKGEALRIFINQTLPEHLERFPDTKLVVIDSIAGIYRQEMDYIGRAKEMYELVYKLQSLANTYNFAIVTTNHVTSVPGEYGGEKASLGSAWDSLIVTKMKVEKTDRHVSGANGGPNRLRTLEVCYSPRLPSKTEGFVISSRGLEDFGKHRKLQPNLRTKKSEMKI